MGSIVLPLIHLLLVCLCVATVGAYLCGPYEREIINQNGQIRCIPNPGSCEDSPDYVDNRSCDERGPCFDFRICYYQFLRTKCYPDPCNRCKPRIYDHLYNEVCKDE